MSRLFRNGSGPARAGRTDPSVIRHRTPPETGLLRRCASVRSFVLDTVYPEEALCLACGAVVRRGCLCDRCRGLLLGTPSAGTPLPRSGLPGSVFSGEAVPDSVLAGSAFLDAAFSAPASDGSSFPREARLSGLPPESWAFRDLNGVPAFSLRLHRGPARALVLALKHRADACAAEELASLLLPVPSPLALPPETVVTWVPMPARRRRSRCIDHGRVLAEAFAGRLNLSCRPLLIRRRGLSRTQASLGRRARESNLRRSFFPACSVEVPVLLVDDVLTTGTTALRCIEALRAGGATDITVLTATHAG